MSGHQLGRALVVLVVLGSVSCKRFFKEDGTKTLSSAVDGSGHKRTIDVPNDWSTDVEKNAAAEITAGSRSADVFVMVICEPKAGFADYTLDRYSDLTRGQVMKNLVSGKSSAKVHREIDKHPALEAELRGGFRDGSLDEDGGAQVTGLVYLHTSVELTTSYCQVVGWTNGRRWNEASALLHRVTDSFREEG